MNKKEVLFTIGVTVVCYILCFVCKSWYFFTLLNVVLSLFYILYAVGKLPQAFYTHKESTPSLVETSLLWIGIIYLLCCLFASVIPQYTKLIGRIVIVVTIVSTAIVMISLYLKRLYGEMSKKQFLHSHIYYFRLFMIILTNFYLFPLCSYSYGASYDKNGRLISKDVVDGLNTYQTLYVDSLSCYVTHAKIEDSDDKKIDYLEYIVYYKKYPDKIDHIDTIKITKR